MRAGRVASIALMSLCLGVTGVASGASSSPATRLIPTRIELPGLGARTMLLEHNRLLAPDARSTETDGAGTFIDAPRSTAITWRGTLREDPSAVVRLTTAPGMTDGLILAGGRTYVGDARGWRALDPAGGDAVAGGSVDLLSGDDDPVPSQRIGAGVLNCSVMSCAELTAQIVLDGDVFFRNRAPARCFDRQLAGLNAIDGIFAARGIQVRFSITQQNCRTVADLGERGSDLVDYHEALKAWWDEQGSDRSLVHLFAGFDFAGNGLGRTYSPAICARVHPDPLVKGPPEQRCPFGYSMSQTVADAEGLFVPDAFSSSKLLANIFGYAFGGSTQDAEGCGSERRGTLLCSPIQWNGPNAFSEANERRIRAHAEQKLGYFARVP